MIVLREISVQVKKYVLELEAVSNDIFVRVTNSFSVPVFSTRAYKKAYNFLYT